MPLVGLESVILVHHFCMLVALLPSLPNMGWMKALESKELGRQVAYHCIAYEVPSGDRLCHVSMRAVLQLAW